MGTKFKTLDDDFALAGKTLNGTKLAIASLIEEGYSESYLVLSTCAINTAKGMPVNFDLRPISFTGVRKVSAFYPLRELREDDTALTYLSSVTYSPKEIVELEHN